MGIRTRNILVASLFLCLILPMIITPFNPHLSKISPAAQIVERNNSKTASATCQEILRLLWVFVRKKKKRETRRVVLEYCVYFWYYLFICTAMLYGVPIWDNMCVKRLSQDCSIVSKAWYEQFVCSKIGAEPPMPVASCRKTYWLQGLRDFPCYLQQLSSITTIGLGDTDLLKCSPEFRTLYLVIFGCHSAAKNNMSV